MQPRNTHKNQPHVCTLRVKKPQLKVWVCYSEPCLTFTVGIIISKWAEAILTHTAVSCLQVHTVWVLHAAVTLWAEVMTCRRRREEKVETQRKGVMEGCLERLGHSTMTFSHTIFLMLLLSQVCSDQITFINTDAFDILKTKICWYSWSTNWKWVSRNFKENTPQF